MFRKIPLLAIIATLLTISTVHADDGVPRLSQTIRTDPMDVSAGFSMASLTAHDRSFFRPSAMFGLALLPEWWISPYADFRVGTLRMGFDGAFGEAATLSTEFEKKGFATAVFGGTATLYRKNRLRLSFHGEYEFTIGGARASVRSLDLELNGTPFPVADTLGPDDRFSLDWRRWETGLTARTQIRRSKRVSGTFALLVVGQSTSVDVSLSQKTAGLLTLIGSGVDDVNNSQRFTMVRPAFLPGIEVVCAPWLRLTAKAIVLPLLHGEGFAYGGSTRFVARPF